jgi:hypothetical protein
MEQTELKRNVRQYLALKGELEVLTTRQLEIKKRLIEVVEEEPANDNGHRLLSVEDDIVGGVTLTRQKKVSKNLDMDVAEEILTKKGIKDTCIKMMPVLDEAAIMAAFYDGYLTEEDIDTMFPAKVTYAFLVNVK